MEIIFDIFSVSLGLILGSFANVCIFRMPHEESIVSPGSYCPTCHNPIKWYYNIPIVSYIFLLGRCATCSSKIPFRYPLVEGLTGVISLILFRKFNITLDYAFHLLFCLGMIIVFFVDYEHYIIPNEISLGFIPLGLFYAFLPGGITIYDSIFGFFTGTGLFGVVALGYYLLKRNEGLGLGDVKLIGMIGVFLGLKAVIFTILFGSMSGTLLGVIYLLIYKKDRHTPIPFGPFLSASAIMSIFFKEKFFSLIIYAT